MVITRATGRASAAGAGSRSPRARVSFAAGAYRRPMIMLAGVLAAGAPLAQAQTWKITPAVSWESTFTDNVNLASSDRKESDWINQIAPTLQFSWVSAHTRAAGRIGLPVLLYVNRSESNEVRPEVAVTATWEAIERFFFIDAAINVSQQFLSP